MNGPNFHRHEDLTASALSVSFQWHPQSLVYFAEFEDQTNWLTSKESNPAPKESREIREGKKKSKKKSSVTIQPFPVNKISLKGDKGTK